MKKNLNEEIQKIKSLMKSLNENDFTGSKSQLSSISENDMERINKMKSVIQSYNLPDLYKSGLIGGQPKETFLADFKIESDSVELNFSTEDDKYHITIKYELSMDWEDEVIEDTKNVKIKIEYYESNNLKTIYEGNDIFDLAYMKLSDGNSLDYIIFEYMQERIWEQIERERDDYTQEPDNDDDYDPYSHLKWGYQGDY